MKNSRLSKKETLQKLYWIISVGFIGVLFLVDLAIPLGVATGILYIFPVFLGIFLIEDKKAPIFLGLLSVSLIVLVVLLSEPNVEFWKAIVNRTLSILFMGFGITLISIYKESLRSVLLSEEKMTEALERAPNGILHVNSDGKITFANKEVMRMFDYSKEELINKNVDELVPKDYRGDHPSHRKDFVSNPQDRAMGAGRDLYGLRKDGTEVPIEIGLKPIKTSAGFFVMCSIIDITERKKQEEEQEKMIEKLKRSNQELDDFAYIASHDLKEPLRGIHNNANFLMEDYGEKLDEDGVRRLKRLGYLTQRLETLVNDLLYYSRLGRTELAIQSTDLNEVIRGIKTLMDASLTETRARINILGELPTIVCDKPRVTEVFQNLITNAIKYNNKPEKLIEVGFINKNESTNPHKTHIFFVRDNGMGIENEFHNDIFRIFKRLNEEDDTKKGTGVGLTFVKKIIERHNGKIWLESEIRKGTTFYFTLEQGASSGRFK